MIATVVTTNRIGVSGKSGVRYDGAASSPRFSRARCTNNAAVVSRRTSDVVTNQPDTSSKPPATLSHRIDRIACTHSAIDGVALRIERGHRL